MLWYELQDLMFLVKCITEPSDKFDTFYCVHLSSGKTHSSSHRKLVFRLPPIDLALSITMKNIYLATSGTTSWTNLIHVILAPTTRSVPVLTTTHSQFTHSSHNQTLTSTSYSYILGTDALQDSVCLSAIPIPISLCSSTTC